MARKAFDPQLVSNLVARGTTEARQAAPVKSKRSRRHIDKRYLSVRISSELIDALYTYQMEYRRTNPQQHGLHPGIGGAVEHLLRNALSLKPL